MHVKPFKLSRSGLGLGAASLLMGSIMDQEQSTLPEPTVMCEAWTMAIINLLFIGPSIYSFLAPYTVPRKLFRKCVDCVSIVGAHSFFYSLIHRGMHKIKALRPIHRFHHNFKETVIPTAANAVSVWEFLLAYMTPFVPSILIFKPDSISLFLSASFISLMNILVHSPSLENKTWIPTFVTPHMHLRHHEFRSSNYSAPTFYWKFL